MGKRVLMFKMKKLEWDKTKPGRYFLNGILVKPVIVYGPIFYRFSFDPFIHQNPPINIEEVMARIERDVGINLEGISDSYVSGEITIRNPQTPKKPARSDRLAFISFCKTRSLVCDKQT